MFVFWCSILYGPVEQTLYICFSLKQYLKVKHLVATMYAYSYKQNIMLLLKCYLTQIVTSLIWPFCEKM